MPFGYTFSGNCKGTTKSGKPCGQKSIYANGYCRHHGGDSTEFMRERIKQIVAKRRARLEKFKRRVRLGFDNTMERGKT